MIEDVSRNEQSTPENIYQHLNEIYQQLPLIPGIPESLRDKVTARRKEFPDGANLTILPEAIVHYGSREAFRVEVGYGMDNYLNFELTPEGLKYLDYQYSVGIGETAVLSRARIQLPAALTLESNLKPDLNEVAKSVVDWVGELTQSDSFIQPPITTKLTPF